MELGPVVSSGTSSSARARGMMTWPKCAATALRATRLHMVPKLSRRRRRRRRRNVSAPTGTQRTAAAAVADEGGRSRQGASDGGVVAY